MKNILFKLNYLLNKKYKFYICIFVLTFLLGLVFQLIGISSIVPLTASFFDQTYDNEIFKIGASIFPFLNDVNNFLIFLTFFTVCVILSNLIFPYTSLVSYNKNSTR